jgi:cobalt-precorrin 5A hydrolase
MGFTKKYAVWAITPNGVYIAKTLAQKLSDVDLFLSAKLAVEEMQTSTFDVLADTISEQFRRYDGHIFIMATGIVVRMIAPLIQSKMKDPAVVVLDDRGQHAVSLLSGHIGGANALADQIAECIGAEAVITTATDVNQAPAIDVLATEQQLFIENPQAIKTVNMALLQGQKIWLHDPYGYLRDLVPDSIPRSDFSETQAGASTGEEAGGQQTAGVYIDDIQADLPPQTLVLRPPTLMAGIGCNRDTGMQEMKELLERVFEQFNLSPPSLIGLASIGLKADEAGLLALALDLDLPLRFYDREKLNRVKTIENPSRMVEKHVGVKSVCEAAAILAAQNGTLVVPKQTTRNVTIAVARIASISSASAPAIPSI